MSTLNKYIIFQCDTCKRQTELQISGQRVDPIRCIITYKCRGKLSRIGESSGKKFLFTPPVSGLQDYIQRGTVINPALVLPTDPSVSLNTSGGAGMLSMAILKRTADTPSIGSHQFSILDPTGSQIIVDTQVDAVALPQNVKILLNIFPISPSVLQSTLYTYLKTGEVNVISGADNSPDANTLRFDATNNISVYSNGIELSPSAYIVSIPDQSITFTPTIYEQNNVIEIIVYNDLAANVSQSSIIALEFDTLNPSVNGVSFPFISDVAFLNECAWGDYYAANIPGVGIRYLMHCTNLSTLLKDISYGIDSITVITGSPIAATSMVDGTTYTISTLGTTPWELYGAPIGFTIGTVFVAINTSPGVSGNGQVTTTAPLPVKLSEANLLLAKDPYDFKDKELNAFLSGSEFTSTSFSFTFSQDQLTGIYKFTTLQSTLTQLLQPLIPSEKIPATLLATQSTAGATTAPAGLKHSYIIGPT